MLRSGFVLAALIAVAARCPAVSPDPKDHAVSAADRERAKALVDRLGSPSYRDREAATRELADMGRRAAAALAAAATSGDPEVRARAGRLLPAAAADDLRVRVDAFLADADDRFDHALPGWAKFKAALGADGPARELFAAACRSAPAAALLASVDGPADGLAAAVADRRVRLLREMRPTFNRFTGVIPAVRQPTPVDVAAVVFADLVLAADPAKPPPGKPIGATTASLLTAPEVRPAVAGTGPHGPAFRRLLAGWFGRVDDPRELIGVVSVASVLKVKDALPAVRRAAKPGGAVHLRAQAATTLAALGGADELPALTGMLADAAVLLPNRVAGVDLQIRDVALAMAVAATGQDALGYGFTVQQPLSDANRFNYWQYFFPTPEARTTALQKWAAWEAERPATGGGKGRPRP